MLKLVAAARAGNQDAYEEIVFAHRDQVYNAAWHLTRNHEDALDVTQEAFIRAYNALASYKGKSRFSTWLHRIVLNAGIDYIRREKRHKHQPLDANDSAEDGTPAPAESSTPAEQRSQVYGRELQGHVLAALQQLSRRQRQVFILRYYHDLDIKETAKVLKCTDGSVKRHLFRAQERLRELLKDFGSPNHGK